MQKAPCNVRWRSLLRLRLRCPFCLANRLAALRTERQRSLALTPAASPALSVLSCESPCGSSDRKATFAGAHSSGFAYAVQPAKRIACGSPGRMATFAAFVTVHQGRMTADGNRRLIQASGDRHRVEKYREIYQKPTLTCRGMLWSGRSMVRW